MLTLLKNDPFFVEMKREPEFKRIVSEMEEKYIRVHKAVGKWLEEQSDL
jgi:hypothetical protein